MLTRRQALQLSTGALIAAPTIAAATPTPRTIRAPAPPNDRWDQDLCWVKGSHADHHIATARVPWDGRTLTTQMRFDYQHINQFDFQRDLFHGDVHAHVMPHRAITGFSAYYGTLDRTKAQNAVNVIDGGARRVGLTSIWLVAWGDKTIHMASETVPITSKRLPDRAALVIKDWRYVVRIANVSFYHDSEKLAALLRRAVYRLPMIPQNLAIYMSPDLLRYQHETNPKGITFFGDRIRPVDTLNHWEELIGPVPV